jgi:hypothetical protein
MMATVMRTVMAGFCYVVGLILFMHGMVIVQSTWGLGATWVAGAIAVMLFLLGIAFFASWLDARDENARQIR